MLKMEMEIYMQFFHKKRDIRLLKYIYTVYVIKFRAKLETQYIDVQNAYTGIRLDLAKQ